MPTRLANAGLARCNGFTQPKQTPGLPSNMVPSPANCDTFFNEDKQQSIRTTSCQLPFDSGSLMFTSKSFKFITFLVVLLNRPCPWCCLFLSFFLALSGFLGFILQSSIDCILLPHRPVPAFVLPPQTVHSWPVRSWRLFRRH